MVHTTQNTENELLTHTISCVIMILRFVFVPVKQVKKLKLLLTNKIERGILLQNAAEDSRCRKA